MLHYILDELQNCCKVSGKGDHHVETSKPKWNFILRQKDN